MIFPGRWMWRSIVTSVWPCLWMHVYTFRFCGLLWGESFEWISLNFCTIKSSISKCVVLRVELLIACILPLLWFQLILIVNISVHLTFLGFDIDSFLLCISIMMDVCPWSSYSLLFWMVIKRGSWYSTCTASGLGGHTCHIVCQRQATTGGTVDEAVSAAHPWRGSSVIVTEPHSIYGSR